MMKDAYTKEMDEYTEKISLWLDNELSANEVTELKAHMTTCPACRHTYQVMKHVDTMFRRAAKVMVTPPAGFTQRFETRLVQHRNIKPWQIWLTVSALLFGVVFFFAAWAVVGGVALISMSTSMLDVGRLYHLLTVVIESVGSFRVFLNLWSLALKAGFIILSEPLTWGFMVVGLATVGLWVRVMQTLARRVGATVEMLL